MKVPVLRRGEFNEVVKQSRLSPYLKRWRLGNSARSRTPRRSLGRTPRARIASTVQLGIRKTTKRRMASEQLKQNVKGKVPPSREVPLLLPEQADAKEEAVIVGTPKPQPRVPAADAARGDKAQPRKRKMAKVEVAEGGRFNYFFALLFSILLWWCSGLVGYF